MTCGFHGEDLASILVVSDPVRVKIVILAISRQVSKIINRSFGKVT